MDAQVRLLPSALTWREVDGEIVAVDNRTSTYIAINRAGTTLWPALERGASRDELVALLLSRFSIDAARAASDVDTFVAMLAERSLLCP